jgi:hypothetical protein
MTWGGTAEEGVGVDPILVSDVVVVLGALMFLGGYFFLNSLKGRRNSRFLDHEWNFGTILGVGFVTWVLGFAVMTVYDMTVSPMYIPTHILGLPLGVASNLRLLSPLGALMLIYLAVRKYRPSLVWALLIVMISAEFVSGFIYNSKEISFRIIVLLFMSLYYLNGTISKKFLIAMLLVAVPYLLFFNAYRLNMMEQNYRNPVDALAHFGDNVKAVKRQTEDETGVAASSLQSLVQRIDGKVYVDIIVAGTTSGRVQYLEGESIAWFFYSFIPRSMWREKPDISIGQVFNLRFNLSESRFTFVPTTQLGELYWNFGMTGIVLGMLLIGVVFGWVSAVAMGGSGVTLPRYLVLLTCTYFLAVRFEGNVATQYSTFIRVVIFIWLIDGLLRLFGVSKPALPDWLSRKSNMTKSSQTYSILP